MVCVLFYYRQLLMNKVRFEVLMAGSHEYYCRFGCDTQSGRCLLMFQKNVVPPSSR
jgi:hypothetical protein